MLSSSPAALSSPTPTTPSATARVSALLRARTSAACLKPSASLNTSANAMAAPQPLPSSQSSKLAYQSSLPKGKRRALSPSPFEQLSAARAAPSPTRYNEAGTKRSYKPLALASPSPLVAESSSTAVLRSGSTPSPATPAAAAALQSRTSHDDVTVTSITQVTLTTPVVSTDSSPAPASMALLATRDLHIIALTWYVLSGICGASSC